MNKFLLLYSTINLRTNEPQIRKSSRTATTIQNLLVFVQRKAYLDYSKSTKIFVQSEILKYDPLICV